jgi:glucokinase
VTGAMLVLDLGGTRLKAGVAVDGNLVATDVADVPQDGGREAILDAIRNTGGNLLKETPVAAGICVPGLLQDGVLISLPGKHAGLEGTDFAGFLRATFGVERTAVTNDAIAYAVGEASAGAGQGSRRSVVVTIGTGVGVTVVEDGAPATGGMFGAGILGGFIPISDASGGAVDTIGRHDTIEALCAAHRIIECCDGAYENIPAVYEAFARGEEKARKGIEEYRRRLGRALVALAHAHAPERLILGGGPMTENNPIIGGLQEIVNERLFGTYRVDVRLATLGDNASLVGLHHLLERPS